MKNICKSIYKTLIYQSVFKYSPIFSDFERLLISSTSYAKKDLKFAVKDLKGVSIKNNHIFLEDNDYVDNSIRNVKYSKDKLIIAKKYSQILSKIPWFRMIAVSGAVASLNATKDDDIDFFIIVAPYRIWLARLSDWIILNLLKVRRNANSENINNKICINYYLSEESLELKNKDLYTANEIARLIPLYGEDIYKEFVYRNRWIQKYLANFWKSFSHQNPSNYFYSKPFRFVLFDLLENIFGYLQISYMKRKRTKEIVSEKALRFHPKDVRLKTLRIYKERLDNLKID